MGQLGTLLDVGLIIGIAITLNRDVVWWAEALFVILLVSICLQRGLGNLLILLRSREPRPLRVRAVAAVSLLAIGFGTVAIGMVVAMAWGALTALPPLLVGGLALVALINTGASFALPTGASAPQG